MTDAAVLQRSDQVLACPEVRRATVLRDSWDAHAAEWIAWVRSPDEPDSYFRFHRKHFLSLVPEPGELTLDIGCGEGRVGRDLKVCGHRVLGIDWSFAMCEAAASHPHAPGHVAVGDAAKLPLADSSVDCVTAFMSLQDIDDMPGAISEMARVLDDGKRLALAIVHPMYSGGKFSQTEAEDKDFVVKRSYFKPELCVSEDGHDGLKVFFFREHRPLETYVQALLDAGFIIEQWHEVTDEDESKPWHRVPMFLDILATRKPREDRTEVARRQEVIQHAAKSSPWCLDDARKRILLWAASTRVLSGLGIVAAAAAWLALHAF
jgi:SAM-dependent methyltransferase